MFICLLSIAYEEVAEKQQAGMCLRTQRGVWSSSSVSVSARGGLCDNTSLFLQRRVAWFQQKHVKCLHWFTLESYAKLDVRLKRIGRNVTWIGFASIYECGLKQICENRIACVFVFSLYCWHLLNMRGFHSDMYTNQIWTDSVNEAKESNLSVSPFQTNLNENTVVVCWCDCEKNDSEVAVVVLIYEK